MFAMDSFLLGKTETSFLRLDAIHFEVVTQAQGGELSNHWPLEVRIVPLGSEEIPVTEEEAKVSHCTPHDVIMST